MPGTLTYSTTLDVISCGDCEIPFALPSSLHRSRKQDGGSFWCPNGHKIGYSESENARLRKELKAKERQRKFLDGALTHARDQQQAAERSAAARKGVITRLKNRAAAGICPCCNRHFANVERHMTSQHPGYAQSDTA